MKTFWRKSALLASLVSIPVVNTLATNSSELILGSFSYQCPQVVTRDVGATIQNLNALKVIVEELKSDADCGSSNQLNAVLGRYAALYEDFQVQNYDKQEKIELEKRIASYTQAMSDDSLSNETKAKMSEEMVLAQADLINVKARLKRFDTFSGKEARAANQLIFAVDQYLANIDQNPKCVEKKGAKIAGLVSNVLITTAAFANPGTALALAASGVILQAGTNFVKNKSFDDTVDALTDAQMPTAVRCYSQVLTDQYCSMNDTLKVLEERKRGINQSLLKTSPQLEGLNLLSYQLTGLNKWLEEVYSGSEITSEGDLVNREKPILQAELLKKIKMYVEAYANINTKSLNEIRSEKERSNAIAILTEKLSYIMSSPSLNPAPSRSMFSSGDEKVANPIFATRTLELLPFELYRPGAFPTLPSCGVMNCSFSGYIAKEGIVLSMDNWFESLKNANLIIQSALDAVNVQRSKTISVDAYRIMVNASTDQKGEVNALNGLRKVSQLATVIADRLKGYGCKLNQEDCETPLNPYYPQFTNVLKTKTLSEQIVKLIKETYEPRTLDDEMMPKECRGTSFSPALVNLDADEALERKSFLVISCIAKLLKLEERGTDVFMTKIKDMVSYDLEARLRAGELGDAVRTVVDATRNDLVQSILNSYRTNDGALSIDDIQIGIDTAKNNISKSLTIFSQYYAKDLVTILQDKSLAPLERKDLCFRILPFLSDDEQKLLAVSFENCQNVEFQSYKIGPKISFNDFVEKKSSSKGPFKKTVYALKKNQVDQYCQYRSFGRKNRLLDEEIRRKELLEGLKSIRFNKKKI